jgi:hypothetical protein
VYPFWSSTAAILTQYKMYINTRALGWQDRAATEDRPIRLAICLGRQALL